MYIENTVLVHAGFNTVGQAAIAIALAAGNTVYATVENVEQSKLLMKRFPSVRT
jgi:NADPH:quinone reductase-like Zn-dependent oxidoreductase